VITQLGELNPNVLAMTTTAGPIVGQYDCGSGAGTGPLSQRIFNLMKGCLKIVLIVSSIFAGWLALSVMTFD
jgi:hypothetical protein